jgi:hypothetical protein
VRPIFFLLRLRFLDFDFFFARAITYLLLAKITTDLIPHYQPKIGAGTNEVRFRSAAIRFIGKAGEAAKVKRSSTSS